MSLPENVRYVLGGVGAFLLIGYSDAITDAGAALLMRVPWQTWFALMLATLALCFRALWALEREWREREEDGTWR